MYIPLGCELVVRTPYQMVVVSFVAVVPEVLMVFGDADEGTPAHVVVLDALFVSALVGPAPKPPTLSIRYPQVLFASAVGDA